MGDLGQSSGDGGKVEEGAYAGSAVAIEDGESEQEFGRERGGEDEAYVIKLGLEGERRDIRAREAADGGVGDICDVDDDGGWGNREVEAVGEVEIRGDLRADYEVGAEDRTDSCDARDSEWRKRDLGKGDLEALDCF